MSEPLHYSFTAAAAIPQDQRVAILGGKGAALARMTALELPVPPGFTLTTEACRRFNARGWSDDLATSIDDGLSELEATTGRKLGSATDPLLLSVRSGAAVSMPGMMDTVLNAGMTDEVAAALAEASGDEWFAWDTARRFVQSYASIVLGVPEELLRRVSTDCIGHDEGRSLSPDGLAAATARMRDVLAEEGHQIPTDPHAQVTHAAAAVFTSWRSERARAYRRVEGIDESLGTAATVQMMTFGNLGERSGTGVAFTRDPSTGERILVGDFLVGAQGEDVVAGTHSTLPVSELRTLWPDVADRLDEVAALLEHDLGDLADIEFTVQDGMLWLLQVRSGKRSPVASLRVAIDLAEDPRFPMTRAEAVDSVSDILANPPTRTNPEAPDDPDHLVLAGGLAASPGRVSGKLYTQIDEAIEAGARGESIILVRRETSPADVAGMAEAAGIVTSLGGFVSHAAVVARSWGIPAIVGAADVAVLADGITVSGEHYPTGEVLTVDGERGTLMLGDHPAEETEVDEVRILRKWQQELTELDSPPTRADGTSASTPPGVTSEEVTVESCERILALKGAASAAAVAEVLGSRAEQVMAVISDLLETGAAQELPGERLRLTPEAVDRVDVRFAADAERLSPVIEPIWGDFHDLNVLFKTVVSSWQVREVDGEEVHNDHSDAEYDSGVVQRLRADIHGGIVPVIEVVTSAETRFGRYSERLEASLLRIEAGDTDMFAHPLKDSYHTVWFELHEELIRLSGRNRADEAAAGRA